MIVPFFLIATAGVVVAQEQPRQPQSTPVLIRNVRVFDGEHVADRRDVLIDSGVIRRVEAVGTTPPPNTTIIDGTGRTLLPGLIDAHVHLSDSADADLRQALSLGVTTVIDMFTGGARFERIKALRDADAPDRAAARTAGTGATAPGGHPTQMGGPPFPTLADSSQALAFVDARVAEGSDFIKIIYDDLAALFAPRPTFDRRTLAGVIAATHARGKLAVAHIGTEAQARTAIELGADGLVHLFIAPKVGPDFADFVKQHGAFVIPTFAVLRAICGEPSAAAIMGDSLLAPYIRPGLRPLMRIDPRTARTPRKDPSSCRGTTEAIRALAARGVPLLAGTDSPAPGHSYGASLHRELELLVEAGLTPLQALVAATSAPARAFRMTDRGRIAPGLRADLVLVEGDPTSDVRQTRHIVYVWKRGVQAVRLKHE